MPQSGKPQHLVVLLHGYGANGDDLIGLAPHLARVLPHAVFVSPHAPEPVPGYPGGRQWFGLQRLSPSEIDLGARMAAPPLMVNLQSEIQRYGLAWSQVALVGFSQGAMMALHVGLRLPAAVAGIVAFSGKLPDVDHLPHDITARPPILLAHGAMDEVVPASATFQAVHDLAALGCCPRFHITPGMGHAIDPDALNVAAAFLHDGLGGYQQGAVPPQLLSARP